LPGKFLGQPARLSQSLREREGKTGITPENYQILPPSSHHIYRLSLPNLLIAICYSLHREDPSPGENRDPGENRSEYNEDTPPEEIGERNACTLQ
jgi:hypothetical protein